MKALFVYSTKYQKCGSDYYATSQTADVWKERYLNIFDELVIAGRYYESSDIEGKTISSTDRVTFHCTQLGMNATEYFTKRIQIEKYIEKEVKQVDFVIARQSFFSAIAVKYAKKYGKPYVCEVVGSTWDANWNYSLKGKIVAPYFEIQAKHMIKNADYAIYVTQEFLQKEYPCKGKTMGISNVKIETVPETVLEQRLDRIRHADLKRPVLCTVAAVDVKYKGQAYVIEAMAELKKKGISPIYYIVGAGNQERLKEIARRYGVEEDVLFFGSVKHAEVANILDSADIYIQPSLQEGLPRAMIEAMSRGLPAIGYRTAGIPELIESEYVCRRKSVQEICECIQRLQEREELLLQSRRNFEKAKEYQFEILNRNRENFIRQAMEDFAINYR